MVTPAATTYTLTLERTLRAPRELVFRCWTEDEHLARWQGAPAGMTAHVERKEIRTGGSFRILLRDAHGQEHRVHGEYTEVTPPERLVFTHAWLAADGTSSPWTQVTITFAEHTDGTRMTLHQEGLPTADARDGHKLGWSSQLDAFTGYVDHLD